MFTGIVQTVGQVVKISGSNELRVFEIKADEHFFVDLEAGASVAVNGVCLTATNRISSDIWRFDVMFKSMEITNLCEVETSSYVNLERAAKADAEIGGHPLSGHVDFTAKIIEVQSSSRNKKIRIYVPHEKIKYIFSQGYVGVDGVSLTVSEVEKDLGWFEVWLIPETRRATIIESLGVGDKVNLEIDRAAQVVVETIENTVKFALDNKFAEVVQKLNSLGIQFEKPIDDESTRKMIAGAKLTEK